MVGQHACPLTSSQAACMSAAATHVLSALRELACPSFAAKHGRETALTSI